MRQMPSEFQNFLKSLKGYTITDVIIEFDADFSSRNNIPTTLVHIEAIKEDKDIKLELRVVDYQAAIKQWEVVSCTGEE